MMGERSQEAYEHKPVLLKEVLAALNIQRNGIYVDGTFGRGGHSLAILKELGKDGRLFAMDRDPDAVTDGIEDPRLVLQQGNFADIRRFADDHGLTGKINGMLLDLGVSSPQLDQAHRGFSFLREGPLDMRMNPDEGMSAAQWLNTAAVTDITRVLRDYGEERFAGRIAKAIARQRPVHTTAELAGIVAAAVPKADPHKHPATRTFQAIRIFINGELQAIRQFLDEVIDVMAPGGRIAIISFHSLEDRLVKRFFRSMARGDDLPRDVPVTADQLHPKLKLVGKAQYADEREVDENPRARSAVLRVAEKLP